MIVRGQINQQLRRMKAISVGDIPPTVPVPVLTAPSQNLPGDKTEDGKSRFWAFQDSRGLDQAIQQALGRAQNKSWTADTSEFSSGSRAADLRALLVAAMYNLNSASKTQPQNVSIGSVSGFGLTSRSIDDFNSQADFLANWVPLRWYDVLTKILVKNDPTLLTGLPMKGVCIDGNPVQDYDAVFPVPPSGLTVGFGWPAAILGIAIVVGVVILADHAIEVVDKDSIRNDDIMAVNQQIANLLQINNNHIDQEQKAGKPLPYSDTEKKAIVGANNMIDAAADSYKVAATPTPGFFNSAFNTVTKVGQQAVDLGTILTVGAVVVGGLFLLTAAKK